MVTTIIMVLFSGAVWSLPHGQIETLDFCFATSLLPQNVLAEEVRPSNFSQHRPTFSNQL